MVGRDFDGDVDVVGNVLACGDLVVARGLPDAGQCESVGTCLRVLGKIWAGSITAPMRDGENSSHHPGSASTSSSAAWQALPGTPRGCRAAPFIELLLDDPRGVLPGLDQTSKGGSLRSTGRFCRRT